MPYQDPKPGEGFRKRLGVYLLGVALGLVFLGMFHSMRNQAVQQRQSQQQNQQSPGPASGNP